MELLHHRRVWTCTDNRYNLILKPTVAHCNIVTVVLLIKLYSISFQPKWLPVVSFLTSVVPSTSILPTHSIPLHTSPPCSIQERGGGTNPPILGLHSNCSQMTFSSDLFCWVRNWGMGEGDAGRKERKREREMRDDVWHRRCCVTQVNMKQISVCAGEQPHKLSERGRGQRACVICVRFWKAWCYV